MPTPSISGGVVISGASILLPIDLATIEPGVVMPVELENSTIEVGTILMTVNVGTIDQIIGTVLVQPVGGIIESIGTIENAPLVTVQGTINNFSGTGTFVIDGVAPGAILPVSGSIVITGQTSALNVNAVGTLFMLNTYVQTNLASGVTLTSSSTNILATGTLQNLVLDVVYGTVVVGSIQTSIWGVEPQSQTLTSVLVQGSWYSGTVQAGQRLVASAPLGAQVAVITTVIGTVMDVYITAEQST